MEWGTLYCTQFRKTKLLQWRHASKTAAKSEKALIIKKEMESKGEPVAPDHSYMNIDLTQEAPLASQPRSDNEVLMLKSMGVSTIFSRRRWSFLRTSAREKRKLTKKIFTDKKFGCGWRHLFQRVPTPGCLAQSTPHLTYMLCTPGLPVCPTKLHGFPMLSNSRKYLRSLCRETMFLPITQLCCDKFNWSGPKAPLGY